MGGLDPDRFRYVDGGATSWLDAAGPGGADGVGEGGMGRRAGGPDPGSWCPVSLRQTLAAMSAWHLAW